MGVSLGERARNPELITIEHEDMRAQVNQIGACLETCTWSPEAGEEIDLLLPRGEATEGNAAEEHGGAFFCAPFFGPSPDTDGTDAWQHGWARRERWNIIRGGGTSGRIELFHAAQGRDFGAYQGLESYIVYELQTSPEDGAPQLNCALTCTNYGQRPMLLAPGLRPYFPNQPGATHAVFSAFDARGGRVSVALDRADLAAASMIGNSKSAVQFVAAGREITMRARGLEHWIGWTRAISEYLCVGPTVMGAVSEVDSRQGESPPQLGVGECTTYATTIEWRRMSSAGRV